MARYSVAPLVAVGYEGLFGTLSILLALPVLAHYSYLTPFFDLPRGWRQMIDSPTVLWSGVAIAFSISLFNFFGLSVTRHVSATARSLTDTCRTLSIWVVSLMLGWEMLVWPISVAQVVGFALLVYVSLSSGVGAWRCQLFITDMLSFFFSCFVVDIDMAPSCSTISLRRHRVFPNLQQRLHCQRTKRAARCSMNILTKQQCSLRTSDSQDTMSSPANKRLPLVDRHPLSSN